MQEKIAFRVDGGDGIGMGHIMECLQLGKVFRERYGMEPYFFIARDETAKRVVRQLGFPVVEIPAGEGEIDSIKELTEDLGIRKLILNLSQIPDGLTREFKEMGLSLINIVEAGKDQSSDLVIDLTREPWLMMVDLVFVQAAQKKEIRPEVSRVLVGFGSNDPLGETLRVVRALHKESWIKEFAVVTGIAFRYQTQLNELKTQLSHLILLSNLSLGQVAHQMLLADLAVTAGGDMMYELVTVGTPSVILCPLERQFAASQFFQSHGLVDCLGIHTRVSDQELVERIRKLAQDPARRVSMSREGRALMDGQGSDRVVHRISKLWNLAAVC